MCLDKVGTRGQACCSGTDEAAGLWGGREPPHCVPASRGQARRQGCGHKPGGKSRRSFLVKEFGEWGAGNAGGEFSLERTRLQEGQGWPCSGKDGKRSTRLWITTLCWEQVRSSRLLLCWRGSWVGTGAEVGSRPHGSQGIQRNHHQSPACAPQGQRPSKERSEGTQSTPARFPAPPCTPPLSSWDPRRHTA